MANSAAKLSALVISAATGPYLSKSLISQGKSFTTAYRAPVLLTDLKNSTKMATTTIYEDFHSKRIDARLLKIENELREIKEMLQINIKNEKGVPELRGINLDQAKDEIALYFRENDGKEIGYEEIIEGLQIEPSIVVRACNELVDEGKIG